MPSFDVVSKVDTQEVDNAVNQAIKEIQNRYDFRGSKSQIEFNTKDSISIVADDEMKLKAVTQILNEKLSKRGVSVKSLDYQKPEGASGGIQRQKVLLKQGISKDDGKTISKMIKDKNMKKTQVQIQGDQLRVTAPKKDDLQHVISILKEKSPVPVQFVNFKD